MTRMDHKPVKISVIGGGSVFTPELITMLGQNAGQTGPLTVSLMDISEERLDIVGEMCKRIINKNELPIQMESTMDPVEAVRDSAFVCNQLRAGGVLARIEDEKLGHKYHLPYTETISVCGFATYLRSFPMVAEYAHIIAQNAPDAWILNFTNPAGMLAETFYRLGHKKVLGVCNVSVRLTDILAEHLHVPPSSIYMNWRGINHMTFVDRVIVNGENRIAEVLSAYRQAETGLPFPDEFIRALGVIPNPYLQYYFLKNRVMDHLQTQEKNRSEIVLELEKQLLDEFKTASAIPEALKRRGGYGYSSVVANLIKDLITDGGGIHYAIFKNENTLTELPAEGFIEAPVLVHKNRVQAVQIEPLPAVVKPLVITMKLYETALIDACFKRDVNQMLECLLMHPLIQDFDLSRALLEDVLEVNSPYLGWLKK